MFLDSQRARLYDQVRLLNSGGAPRTLAGAAQTKETDMGSSRGDRLVYSTGIGRVPVCSRCGLSEDACRCKAEARAAAAPQRPGAPRDGVVRLALDRKGRGGKSVTLAIGVPADDATLAELTQTLKRLCGAGGALKGDTIEIQGDHRDRIAEKLVTLGYKVKRMGG